MTRIRSLVLSTAVLFLPCGFLSGAQPATRPNPATTSKPAPLLKLDQVVRTKTAAILDGIKSDADFPEAAAKLDALFDQVAAKGSDRSLDAFRDAAFARRLVYQLGAAPADQRMELLQYLREHDNLARTMAFACISPAGNHSLRSPQQSPYTVLLQLREKFGDQVDKYANLTTALCMVHNRPFVRHINENLTKSPPVIDLFAYYTTYEKSMVFGIKNVPPELLIYVVDTTASIEEMKWAIQYCHGDAMVGRHFFDINYDMDFLQGKPKAISSVAYTLQNIKEKGGICADQAFFATELGKAIGVPTAYTTGESATVGHAWVGFLQDRNGEGVWNFDEGRYSAYRWIRGNVIDPQTLQAVPDSFVSLLAELIGTKNHKLSAEDRHSAIALTDAAIRVGELAGGAFAPAELETGITELRPTARKAGTEGALELLKSAVLQNKGYPQAWYAIWAMAKEGKLTMAQKKEWRDAVLSACGTKYPDFSMLILTPIIASVDDPLQQNQWWETVFAMFQARADLCAAIRMNQAKLWEDQKQPQKAGVCYLDVLNRYTNAGPFVLGALVGAEKLLAGTPDKVLKLYEQTFAKTQKPQEHVYIEQSNWYQIGRMYASKLREAGKTREADAVMTQLGQ